MSYLAGDSKTLSLVDKENIRVLSVNAMDYRGITLNINYFNPFAQSYLPCISGHFPPDVFTNVSRLKMYDFDDFFCSVHKPDDYKRKQTVHAPGRRTIMPGCGCQSYVPISPGDEN